MPVYYNQISMEEEYELKVEDTNEEALASKV
jgi:hypothetical protein